MKRNIIISIATITLVMCSISYGVSSCGNKEDAKNSVIMVKPLNITILLDLSDRLTRDLTPSQTERDIAIVNNIVKRFTDEAQKTKGSILHCKNCMRVLFYPTPNIPTIASLSQDLSVDLSQAKGAEKKQMLIDMPQKFENGLNAIYQKTLATGNWVGSDIWGFFSNKKVDNFCIKKDYRNVIVILTDGYLFHVDSKFKDGNAYSYILPQTLAVNNSELIVKRNCLENLEVLMLEINPYKPAHLPLMSKKLETWFENMGVSIFMPSETDMPSNTAIVIDSFFN